MNVEHVVIENRYRVTQSREHQKNCSGMERMRVNAIATGKDYL